MSSHLEQNNPHPAQSSRILNKSQHFSVIRVVHLIARVVIGVSLLYAGIPKLTHPTQMLMGLQAYELFPYELSRFLATFVPLCEIALGVAIITGIQLKIAVRAAITMLLCYIALIISAWARGLSIDCGCFSSGGQVDAANTTYLQDIIRDLLMIGALALIDITHIWAKIHKYTIIPTKESTHATS